MDWQITLCDIQNLYSGLDINTIGADFTIYRSTDPQYVIACTHMTLSNLAPLVDGGYICIEGHITRHESEVDGQTVSTYTIDGGAETSEDASKTYTTVRAAVEAASSQEADVPSEEVYYIKARAKNIVYYNK
jgi:hypothetical protein